MADYNGKSLADYDLWALGMLLHSFKEQLQKREEAAKHPKFAKMNITLPSPNPKFLELLNEVELEIRKKQNA